jgi:hypothetical protein
VQDDFKAQLKVPRVYCRIYRVIGGPQAGRWEWSAATWYNAGTGYAATPREAAVAAEAALMARLALEQSRPLIPK